jgi:hypothetical protein
VIFSNNKGMLVYGCTFYDSNDSINLQIFNQKYIYMSVLDITRINFYFRHGPRKTETNSESIL